MDKCHKCQKPIVFPDVPKVQKFSDKIRLSVRCPHCGALNIKEIKS